MSISLLWGGGLMRRIKTPQQDFAIKRWGGGRIAGHYGNCKYGKLCHEFTSNMASVQIVMMLTRSQSWKVFFVIKSCLRCKL